MEIAAKLMALDIAMLALLSEHTKNVKLWERIERFTAEIIHDPAISEALADKIQDYLDSWRESAGPDADRPAAP